MSAAQVVHADHGFSGKTRRLRFLIRGPFNDWGAGKDIPHQMEQNDDGLWELEMMATWPTYMRLNVGALTISSMVMWTAMVFLTVFLPTRLRPTTSRYLPLPLLISLGPFLRMTRLRLEP